VTEATEVPPLSDGESVRVTFSLLNQIGFVLYEVVALASGALAIGGGTEYVKLTVVLVVLTLSESVAWAVTL